MRHPEYGQDYNHVITPDGSVKDQKEYERIIKKWNLPFLPDPHKVKRSAYEGGAWSEEIFQAGDVLSGAVKVIPHQMGKRLKKTGKKWVEVPFDELVAIKRKKGRKHPERQIDYTPHLEKGRYLTLKVDLWATRKEILKGFEQELSFYRKKVKLPKKKQRTTSYDLWPIYDMHKAGKTYEEIVKKIEPTQDKDVLLARIDAARSAYRKANRAIRSVTPSGL
ncbi:MAG: hypothetical protein ACE5IC_00025 [Candidatus Brocadiales bacterium]